MANLEFLRTMTLDEFKDELGITNNPKKQLGIVCNPHTGKLFVTLTNQPGSIAAVASKFNSENVTQELTKPMVSEVKGEPTEKNPDGVFFLVHQMGEGQPVLMTL